MLRVLVMPLPCSVGIASVIIILVAASTSVLIVLVATSVLITLVATKGHYY